MSAHQTLFHAVALTALSYPYVIMNSFDTKASLSFGGRMMHLTIIGLGITWVLTAIALVNDLVANKAVTHLRHTVLALAFPLETVITLFYWGIRSHNKNLLVNPDDPDIGLFGDCSFHLIPGMVVWLELCCFSPAFRRQSRHLVTLMLFTIAYGAWVQLCYHMNGFWAYPFLSALTHSYRLAFYVTCGVIACGAYLLGANMHTLLHPLPQKKSL
ncbi:FAR-17a/AIG1-like protein [Thamnocephalis sphaerospora]|uniref:FAR-17a/AIG1-like protein n=1 Tax=Thamnocephalis sphaerospora TaxID=78915 RepID=A0A4P9XMN6_9FUNG|nr:FAR-17a/AIG1-like protein [Thamnocephalis sphaerospora]|eukprot:RKP07155.1 FAR-17a/AIG1-like protein [Thamnocephalis sphaerospora]